ncbi:MAG: MFS transporter [Acidimicrobiales bacterium]|nr:MFS transporter [Acidimicrobiales bacterium]
MTEKLRAGAGDTFRSLRIRNFRLFFFGQLISQTGTWLTMVTLTLLVLDLTDSGVAIGLLTATMFGPVLVLGAWAGSLADRSDKHRLLIVAQTAAMVQSLILAAVVFAGIESLPVIYGLAAMSGVITSFDNPARRAFVVEMVPEAMMPNAVSLNSALMTGARVIGPAAGGLLVVTVGYGWAFLIDGLSYLAVLYGLLAMDRSELRPAELVARGRGQVREGVRYVRRTPVLGVPLVMMAVIGTFAFNFSVTIPLLVTGPLHSGEGMFTVLFSVLSVGSMVGALWTARRTDVTNHQIVVAAVAFGGTMIALAAVPALWAAFPVAVLLGAASITFMTTSTAIVQMRAAPELRGRVLALQSVVFLGSTPIGGPIVGWIADAFGARAAVLLGGVACLAAAAWAQRALAGRSDEPSVEPALTLAD